MDSDLQKLAAVAIRQLQDENKILSSELSSRKEAEKLAFSLLKSGHVSVENLESKINELSNKTSEEINIIKKAHELSKTASFSAFKLDHNAPTYDNLDPLTRLLLEDI